MIGLADHERVDEELYDDFETARAREVSLFLYEVSEFNMVRFHNGKVCKKCLQKLVGQKVVTTRCLRIVLNSIF